MTANDHDAAISTICKLVCRMAGAAFAGVGHRVVHGGQEFCQPVLIDDRVIAELETLIPLAPLHQPHHIAAIRAVAAAAPQVPQVACFDTAFHQSQPAVAQQFALPRELTAKGIRRYGFHGLSYEYIVSALPQIAPECAQGRLVVAHLGNGASLCAIDKGRSVATTMGFTPVDGLMMGTRTGTLDPGVVLYLLQHEGMSVAAVERLIYEKSGLLGVSALSSDMRTLLASDRAGRGRRSTCSSIASVANWVHGDRARWPRRARLHRRDRRARGGNPRPGMPRRRMARHPTRRNRQPGWRAAHLDRRRAGLGLGRGDQREFDGGSPYATGDRRHQERPRMIGDAPVINEIGAGVRTEQCGQLAIR